MRVARSLAALALALGAVSTLPQARAASVPSTVYVEISPGGRPATIPGGLSTLTFGYSPAVVTVKPGTAVVWTNKSVLPEPHFVTFLTPDAKTGTMVGGPEFLIVRPRPGKKGSTNPRDLEFLENPIYVLPSEVSGAPFRNSGYLWPEGMVPPGGRSSWKTTFTARDAGKTFVYTCVIHPWMVGRVTVTR